MSFGENVKKNWAKKEKELYEKALYIWGREAQEKLCVEEMLELGTLLLQNQRKDRDLHKKIIEEIVDSEIMINQMKLIYCQGVWNRTYRNQRIEKLARLELRLKEALE